MPVKLIPITQTVELCGTATASGNILYLFLFCSETYFSQGGHIANPCPVFFPFVLPCFIYTVTCGLTVGIKTCSSSRFPLFIKADATCVWDRVTFFNNFYLLYRSLHCAYLKVIDGMGEINKSMECLHHQEDMAPSNHIKAGCICKPGTSRVGGAQESADQQ